MGPPGDLRLLSPHNKPVKTADGWISFTVNTNTQVNAFLSVTGRDHLLDDGRFNSVAARAKNVAEWFEIRGAALTDKSTTEWLELFQKADIAAQPCHTLETLPHDKHLSAVGLIQHEQHPTEGTTAAIRSSIRVNDSYLQLRESSQPKGWETKQLLKEMGYKDDEVDVLLASGSAVSTSN
ncbi:MAG: L-carnitine dehydratase/bile acid-inducible protein F [uncultured bacterium]|nr:MAG: L-carnitine dehydratase/bile acid-inducible protein F [uncultured bacterium]